MAGVAESTGRLLALGLGGEQGPGWVCFSWARSPSRPCPTLASRHPSLCGRSWASWGQAGALTPAQLPRRPRERCPSACAELGVREGEQGPFPPGGGDWAVGFHRWGRGVKLALEKRRLCVGGAVPGTRRPARLGRGQGCSALALCVLGRAPGVGRLRKGVELRWEPGPVGLAGHLLQLGWGVVHGGCLGASFSGLSHGASLGLGPGPPG